LIYIVDHHCVIV